MTLIDKKISNKKILRAQKIRSKKLSVLIHNSDTHPNVQSCTVSVHFAEIIDKAGFYKNFF